MRPPYRISVAGPGSPSLYAIRELQRLPEMELVGVLAYLPYNDGMDAGALAFICMQWKALKTRN